MKKAFLLSLALVLLLMFAAAARTGNWVQAEGMATIHNNLVDIARDKAIDNAQRAAVEKAVGVMITSATQVENYEVKLDRILSESKGFINTYRILKEWREGDTYVVSLEADVGMGKLKDRMAAIEFVMAGKSRPRVMIVMSDEDQKDAVAEAAMTRYFLTEGFRCVDAKGVSNSVRSRLVGGTGGRELTRLAQGLGAEVIIIGRVELQTRSFRMGDVEVTSHEVTVSGKVLNGDTGEVIATDVRSDKGEWKTVTERCALELARQMKDEIIARWSGELTNAATIKLIVGGLRSYQDLLRFKEIVAAEVKGFKEIYQRSYADGQAELDIEMDGNSQSLADDLAAMEMNGRRVKIVGITQNRVEAQLAP